MQYSILLTAITALLTTTSATALPRNTQTFNITNFSVSGAPFSISTIYDLDVTDGITSAVCLGSADTLPAISYLPVTCCQGGCAWQFSFGGATGGFNLNVTNVVEGAVDTAIVFFPQSDVMTVEDSQNPNGDFEYLSAPGSFVVTYVATAA